MGDIFEKPLVGDVDRCITPEEPDGIVGKVIVTRPGLDAGVGGVVETVTFCVKMTVELVAVIVLVLLLLLAAWLIRRNIQG